MSNERSHAEDGHTEHGAYIEQVTSSAERVNSANWLTRLDGRLATRRYPKEGVALQWRTLGTGTPLVLLHGGHGNWKHWAANIDALATRHTVWIPDLPGFGASDDPESNTDFDALVQTTLTSINAIFGEDHAVGLAGFSFGGLVAAHLAARRPVSRLALLGPAGHGGPRRAYPALINWRRSPTVEARREALNQNLASFMIHDAAKIDPVGEAIYEDGCVQARFRSKGISYSLALADTLANVSAPTLLVWGTEDVTSAEPEKFSRKLSDQGFAHRFTMIPGAGHWVQYEAAETINALLTEWFATA